MAPTGRGKTSGFVIPNLLTWQGSVVTLDVKGECFEATARHRAAQSDEVYRFASGQTHVAPKKTAPVVQTVIAEEQRQMVMDFGSPVAAAEPASAVDEAQLRSAVDGLGEMEAMLREGDAEKLVDR